MFVEGSLLTAYNVEVVNRRAQTNLRSDRRRAGFELVRQICVNRLLKRHAFDHVATALERIHRVK